MKGPTHLASRHHGQANSMNFLLLNRAEEGLSSTTITHLSSTTTILVYSKAKCSSMNGYDTSDFKDTKVATETQKQSFSSDVDIVIIGNFAHLISWVMFHRAKD
jgi:hypothetical protein